MSEQIHVVPGRAGRTVALVFFLCCLGLAVSVAVAQAVSSLSEEALVKIKFDQKLYARIPLDLRFRDETGREVRLGDYFGRKPVVLNLGYYGCPMLCTLVLNGMVESFQDLKEDVGNQFEVIMVSIDPKEQPALAEAKKKIYLKRYGRPGAAEGWHFLTGDEASIRSLAQEVGFAYAFDASLHEYAHPSGIMVLTPEGRIARYCFGVRFSPAELSKALREADAGRVGSPMEQFVLLCFHFNPITGKYGAFILTVVRWSGLVTLVGLAGLIVRASRHRRALSAAPRNSCADAGATAELDSVLKEAGR